MGDTPYFMGYIAPCIQNGDMYVLGCRNLHHVHKRQEEKKSPSTRVLDRFLTCTDSARRRIVKAGYG